MSPKACSLCGDLQHCQHPHGRDASHCGHSVANTALCSSQDPPAAGCSETAVCDKGHKSRSTTFGHIGALVFRADLHPHQHTSAAL